MAEIVKPNMNTVWANGGAIIAPSNTKIQQGWTAEIPPHQWENWVQNRQDQALLYIMQKGIPEWDNATEYFANRSFVQRNGNLYKAIRNNTNADPLTAGSDWANAIPSATTTVAGIAARATSAEAIAGTNDTKFITPKTLNDKLADPSTGYLRSGNNLSDVANATTARTNLGVVAATNASAGLVRISTVAESTARTSDAVALTPAGLARNIQSNLNDNMADRLMLTGAFGLGSYGAATVDVFPSASLDDALVPSGMYYAGPSVGGRPTTATGVIWHRQTGSVGGQILITNNGELWTRHRVSNTYGAWKRSLSEGDYGLGGSTATPPNGRDSVNPFGWYYQNRAVTWGGGSFFIDMPYGSSMNAGMRLSTDPYTDNFYLQGGISGTKEYRQACQLWHDKNFDPNSKANTSHTHTIANVTGLQTALDGKVSKTGDTMTGNLILSSGSLNVQNGGITSKYDITGAANIVAGTSVNWGNGTQVTPDSIWFNNGHNKYRFYRDNAEFGLALYTGTAEWVRTLWSTAGGGTIHNFSGTVNINGKPINGAELGAIGTYAFLGVTGSDATPGTTRAGTSLTWANAAYAANWGAVGYGTWMCMGYAQNVGGSNDNARATLWVRIS